MPHRPDPSPATPITVNVTVLLPAGDTAAPSVVTYDNVTDISWEDDELRLYGAGRIPAAMFAAGVALMLEVAVPAPPPAS
jgi:hypothetical protein